MLLVNIVQLVIKKGLAMRLNIKPLSVNQAWQGKRFKTPKYNSYIKEVSLLLGAADIPEGYLELNLTFGFSNKNSDADNPVKCFIDCLQKKYGFNDRMIKRIVIDVEHVKKGFEFIDWDIKAIK